MSMSLPRGIVKEVISEFHLHDVAKVSSRATSWQALRQSFLFVEIENQ